jgi:signal transduction histidine kinase
MDSIETSIFTAVLIIAIVLGSIILYFIGSMIRNHRIHYAILKKLVLTEIELLEKERERIARDLHDGLGPCLLLAKMHIIMAGTEKEDDPGMHLSKAAGLVDALNEQFRSIAQNLTPAKILKKGLGFALEDFIDNYREVSSISFTLVFKVHRTIPGNMALHIYRMVQEMVNNSVKHSRASKIQVRVSEKKNMLYVLCKDNGHGAVAGRDIPEKEGKGLVNLQNRAAILGGKIIFQAMSLEGTEYLFELPLTFMHAEKNKNDPGG